jgi:hypothetical protein
MLRKTVTASLCVLGLIPLLALPTLAQDATADASMEVPANAIVSGLNSPAGIAYDADGNLLIALGGTGGDKLVGHSEESGDSYAGITGQVIQVAPDGTQSVVIDNLVSMGSQEGAFSSMRALPDGDSIWLVYGGGDTSAIYTSSAVQVDKATRRVKNYIDLYTIEATQNPDGTDVNSNPFNLALGPDGTLYIIDAGANTIYSWTKVAGLSVFHTWTDDPVPTAMSFAAGGDIYVSFLGTGIAPGAGHVEHWSADGKTLVETFGSLNAVMDVAVGKDGGVYALQLAQFGDQGPMPNSGSIVKLDKTGATPVAEGLNAPFALAQAPDGSWAVTVNAVFSPPGSGAVVKVGG